jgi:hypothetical protein
LIATVSESVVVILKLVQLRRCSGVSAEIPFSSVRKDTNMLTDLLEPEVWHWALSKYENARINHPGLPGPCVPKEVIEEVIELNPGVANGGLDVREKSV